MWFETLLAFYPFRLWRSPLSLQQRQQEHTDYLFHCRVVTDRVTGCCSQSEEADTPALLCCLAWQAEGTGGREEEGVIGGLRKMRSSATSDVGCVFCLSTDIFSLTPVIWLKTILLR